MSPAGTVCRDQSNFCDPAEECNGDAADCPEDVGCGCWTSPSSSTPKLRSAYVRRVVALRIGDDQDPIECVKADNVLQICGMSGHPRSLCASSSQERGRSGDDEKSKENGGNYYTLGRNGAIVGELYPAAYADLRIFLGKKIEDAKYSAEVSVSLDGQDYYTLGRFGRDDATRTSSSSSYWVLLVCRGLCQK